MTDAKSRLFARARKISKDLDRYAAFGYVTDVGSYEKDDEKARRAIDRLYDDAVKLGLRDDAELGAYRTQLREQYKDARQRAALSRRELFEAKAATLGSKRRSSPPADRAFLDELKISRAKGKL
jgi:hypothetical protein